MVVNVRIDFDDDFDDGEDDNNANAVHDFEKSTDLCTLTLFTSFRLCEYF
eukprot:CAMPEP_0168176072 /NCGR_PEP_ID=MMETSP0139_2-20121125/7549_1 /TAXON_ID=44445 /ORGANISM="Pseudo-nitzschia australis, Strain 10249 10 AB" /LENGTH=49 /DNA_ID=CAMNT_0008094679 /DNA_START=906 /DNA_END=1055 /DNA_ORIENTATION=+